MAVEAGQQALRERDRSRRQSAELELDKGFALAQEGHADRGLFWMLRALETAPDGADAFRAMVRRNLGAWLGQVHKPLRIIEAGEIVSDLAFSPDGRSFAMGYFSGEQSNVTPITVWETAWGREDCSPLPTASRPVRLPAGWQGHVRRRRQGAQIVAVDLATRRRSTGDLRLYPAPSRTARAAEIAVGPDGSSVLACLTGPEAAWLLPLDPSTGHPRGEPIRGWQRIAVAPDGRTIATGRVDDGRVNVDVLDASSRPRTATWPASMPQGGEACLFGLDGRSIYCSYAVVGHENPFDNGQNVAEVRDVDGGKPASPLLAGGAHAVYTPAADRFS